MITFIKALLSSKDTSADSVVVCGLLAMLFFCALSTWEALSHHNFDAINYGTGAGIILGSLAGGKGLRDKLTATPQGNP